VKEKVYDANLEVLDVLLTHDKAAGAPGRATPNRGEQIVKERAAA
jgi:hypothetical protein